MHRPVVWYPYNQKAAAYESSQNCPTRPTLTQNNFEPASNPLDGRTNHFSGLPGASLQNTSKNWQASKNVQVNSNFHYGSAATESSIQNTNRPPIASERGQTSDSAALQAFAKLSSKISASSKPVYTESTSHYPNGLYYMTVPVTTSNQNITGGNSGPLTSTHVGQQNFFSNNPSSLVNYNVSNPPTTQVAAGNPVNTNRNSMSGLPSSQMGKLNYFSTQQTSGSNKNVSPNVTITPNNRITNVIYSPVMSSSQVGQYSYYTNSYRGHHGNDTRNIPGTPSNWGVAASPAQVGQHFYASQQASLAPEYHNRNGHQAKYDTIRNEKAAAVSSQMEHDCTNRLSPQGPVNCSPDSIQKIAVGNAAPDSSSVMVGQQMCYSNQQSSLLPMNYNRNFARNISTVNNPDTPGSSDPVTMSSQVEQQSFYSNQQATLFPVNQNVNGAHSIQVTPKNPVTTENSAVMASSQVGQQNYYSNLQAMLGPVKHNVTIAHSIPVTPRNPVTSENSAAVVASFQSRQQNYYSKQEAMLGPVKHNVNGAQNMAMIQKYPVTTTNHLGQRAYQQSSLGPVNHNGNGVENILGTARNEVTSRVSNLDSNQKSLLGPESHNTNGTLETKSTATDRISTNVFDLLQSHLLKRYKQSSVSSGYKKSQQPAAAAKSKEKHPPPPYPKAQEEAFLVTVKKKSGGVGFVAKNVIYIGRNHSGGSTPPQTCSTQHMTDRSQTLQPTPQNVSPGTATKAENIQHIGQLINKNNVEQFTTQHTSATVKRIETILSKENLCKSTSQQTPVDVQENNLSLQTNRDTFVGEPMTNTTVATYTHPAEQVDLSLRSQLQNDVMEAIHSILTQQTDCQTAKPSTAEANCSNNMTTALVQENSEHVNGQEAKIASSVSNQEDANVENASPSAEDEELKQSLIAKLLRGSCLPRTSEPQVAIVPPISQQCTDTAYKPEFEETDNDLPFKITNVCSLAEANFDLKPKANFKTNSPVTDSKDQREPASSFTVAYSTTEPLEDRMDEMFPGSISNDVKAQSNGNECVVSETLPGPDEDLEVPLCTISQVVSYSQFQNVTIDNQVPKTEDLEAPICTISQVVSMAQSPSSTSDSVLVSVTKDQSAPADEISENDPVSATKSNKLSYSRGVEIHSSLSSLESDAAIDVFDLSTVPVNSWSLKLLRVLIETFYKSEDPVQSQMCVVESIINLYWGGESEAFNKDFKNANNTMISMFKFWHFTNTNQQEEHEANCSTVGSDASEHLFYEVKPEWFEKIADQCRIMEPGASESVDLVYKSSWLNLNEHFDIDEECGNLLSLNFRDCTGEVKHQKTDVEPDLHANGNESVHSEEHEDPLDLYSTQENIETSTVVDHTSTAKPQETDAEPDLHASENELVSSNEEEDPLELYSAQEKNGTSSVIDLTDSVIDLTDIVEPIFNAQIRVLEPQDARMFFSEVCKKNGNQQEMVSTTTVLKTTEYESTSDEIYCCLSCWIGKMSGCESKCTRRAKVQLNLEDLTPKNKETVYINLELEHESPKRPVENVPILSSPEDSSPEKGTPKTPNDLIVKLLGSTPDLREESMNLSNSGAVKNTNEKCEGLVSSEAGSSTDDSTDDNVKPLNNSKIESQSLHKRLTQLQLPFKKKRPAASDLSENSCAVKRLKHHDADQEASKSPTMSKEHEGNCKHYTEAGMAPVKTTGSLQCKFAVSEQKGEPSHERKRRREKENLKSRKSKSAKMDNSKDYVVSKTKKAEQAATANDSTVNLVLFGSKNKQGSEQPSSSSKSAVLSPKIPRPFGNRMRPPKVISLKLPLKRTDEKRKSAKFVENGSGYKEHSKKRKERKHDSKNLDGKYKWKPGSSEHQSMKKDGPFDKSLAYYRIPSLKIWSPSKHKSNEQSSHTNVGNTSLKPNTSDYRAVQYLYERNPSKGSISKEISKTDFRKAQMSSHEANKIAFRKLKLKDGERAKRSGQLNQRKVPPIRLIRKPKQPPSLPDVEQQGKLKRERPSAGKVLSSDAPALKEQKLLEFKLWPETSSNLFNFKDNADLKTEKSAVGAVDQKTGSSKATSVLKCSPTTLPWKVKGYWIQKSDICTPLQDQTPCKGGLKSPTSPDLGKTSANCTFLEYKKKFMEKENKVHVA
ncbi:uncharacterized protein LOC121318461 [Polyodon spathula]|uniref:uncharacterized protein LOC121318461 n=1 Tax=Polyodon spathula TaxID=7913 RepID=UPI001B7E7AB8|nr:uncharacterized protein LOC121318461 [Polyodon spathula]